MHSNEALLHKLYAALSAHNHREMAACYQADATFNDIAFNLRDAREIHAMWHMISEGDIAVTVRAVDANDQTGHSEVIDDYTFSDTGRKVHNRITSTFRFRDGLIAEQRDECDPRQWADMALGGINGMVAGRIALLRRWKAAKKLRRFVDRHPEYQ
jgi:uncharacterized protein